MAEPAEPRAVQWPPPARAAGGRCHGSLDAITDTERRALRPIGTSAHEVAVRTGGLLRELLAGPGILLFQGLAAGSSDLPHIPHAVCAGGRIVLVDSVAWPPGRYTVTAAGRIHCDGGYIGQSVGPLMRAVRCWQQAIGPGHAVSALIVVHASGAGRLTLPAPAPPGPAWAGPGHVVRYLRAFLPRAGPPASAAAVAALLAATAEPGR
jgi:hypothetical protein